jgi:hypothetical protein
MPLYALRRTGTAAAIAQAVLHFTLGDVLIATVALVAALAVIGSPAWPNENVVSVAVAVVSALSRTFLALAAEARGRLILGRKDAITQVSNYPFDVLRTHPNRPAGHWRPRSQRADGSCEVGHIRNGIDRPLGRCSIRLPAHVQSVGDTAHDCATVASRIAPARRAVVATEDVGSIDSVATCRAGWDCASVWTMCITPLPSDLTVSHPTMAVSGRADGRAEAGAPISWWSSGCSNGGPSILHRRPPPLRCSASSTNREVTPCATPVSTTWLAERWWIRHQIARVRPGSPSFQPE